MESREFQHSVRIAKHRLFPRQLRDNIFSTALLHTDNTIGANDVDTDRTVGNVGSWLATSHHLACDLISHMIAVHYDWRS